MECSIKKIILEKKIIFFIYNKYVNALKKGTYTIEIFITVTIKNSILEFRRNLAHPATILSTIFVRICHTQYKL